MHASLLAFWGGYLLVKAVGITINATEQLNRQQQIAYYISQDLFARAKVGPIFYVLAIAITGTLADFHSTDPIWFAVALLLIAVVATLRFKVPEPTGGISDVERFITLHWVLVLACVLIWSAFFSWTVYRLGMSSAFIFGLVCTINFSTAIVHQFSPHLYRALVCSSITILPFAIVIGFYQQQMMATIIAIVLYLPYLVSTAKTSHKEYFKHLHNKLELNSALKELGILSATDELTGLFNRREFNRKLENSIKLAHRTDALLSLILVDIDHFKAINDQYGHQAGDSCIVHIADILTELFARDTDTVCRIGGEEFAIIILGGQQQKVEARAQQLQQSIACLPCNSSDAKIPVTASIGVALHTPESTTDSQRLFKLADDALYRAKSRGRNCVELA